MKRVPAALAAALIAGAGGAGPAAAEEEAKAVAARAGEVERPWAKGVALERQRTALALFREGNARLKESVFIQAAAKYREALRAWDHPAIHYNLVLALFYLDQPLEVREHLAAALRYGPEPLEADKFEQAKAYKTLVERQLARVQLRCDEPGAEVVMDGRTLFVAPGAWEDYVRPGPHTIVAKKPEYLTQEVSRTLGAGESSGFDLRLYKASELTRYRRRWPAKMPWTVVAAGAAAGLAGGGLHYAAARSLQSYDRAVEARGGSAPEADLVARRTRGEVMQGFAIGCYAAGGAALLTGAVLAYLNRLQPYQELPPVELPKPKLPAELSWRVGPMLGGGVQGVQAAVQF